MWEVGGPLVLLPGIWTYDHTTWNSRDVEWTPSPHIHHRGRPIGFSNRSIKCIILKKKLVGEIFYQVLCNILLQYSAETLSWYSRIVFFVSSVPPGYLSIWSYQMNARKRKVLVEGVWKVMGFIFPTGTVADSVVVKIICCFLGFTFPQFI